MYQLCDIRDMESTNSINVVVYVMGAIIISALVLDLWLELRWARDAQSMHATSPQDKRLGIKPRN